MTNLEAKIMSPEVTIGYGIDFILSHLEEPHWPRTISTKTTSLSKWQVLVFNREEALARFKQANLLDCRINAYPDYTGIDGLNRQAPNLIFIDLDLSLFNSRNALDKALAMTQKDIRERLHGGHPSIIESGNGYHIYLPIESFILELESVFADYESPSVKFLRFAEYFLSNGKADTCHSSNLSFKNCMLRIPGSHNSKCVIKNNNIVGPTTEVKIIQKWDGNRPAINWLLRDFRRYLIQHKINSLISERKKIRYSDAIKASTSPTRVWIETFLNIPIHDYRKYALRLIVVPYLTNIKRLSYDEAFTVVKQWLDLCNKKRSLDFNPDVKIKDSLKAAARIGYLPIAFRNFKEENPELYNLIFSYHGGRSLTR